MKSKLNGLTGDETSTDTINKSVVDQMKPVTTKPMQSSWMLRTATIAGFLYAVSNLSPPFLRVVVLERKENKQYGVVDVQRNVD